MEDFKFDKLSKLVQQRDETKKRSTFQKAEIYLPLPILKVFIYTPQRLIKELFPAPVSPEKTIQIFKQISNN
jgi:hypothetical protein